MRQNTEQHRWTGCTPTDIYNPSGVLTGVSVALFDMWLHPGRVIASRCPGRTWKIGTNLYRDMDIQSHMEGRLISEDTPLFLITRRGLGLLSHRYKSLSGLGLFVHFHAPVEAAARAVNHGLPGLKYLVSPEVEAMGAKLCRRDEAVYGAMSESWRRLTELLNGFLRPDSRNTVSVGALADWIMETSAAAGCGIKMKQSAMPWTRAVCYRPRLWETFLLYSLLLARETSLCRHTTCELSVIDGMDGGFLAAKVEFPMIQNLPDSPSDVSDRLFVGTDNGKDAVADWLEYSMRFMERVVGRSGGCATHQAGPVYPAPLDNHVLCRDVTLDMCFLQDPDREPGGDMKAHLDWKKQE